ncbi:hypothetical protein FJZ36_14985 [Candidatus Poribacteria bacterium]|nr:hypothetical protein [Candidatus Poribacteria bacterium]
MVGGDLRSVYNALRALLEGYTPPFEARAGLNGGGEFHLWSVGEVTVAGRTRSDVHFAGVVCNRDDVTLHFMPMYAFDDVRSAMPRELLGMARGKACLHFRALTPSLLEDIKAALQLGLAAYIEHGWVQMPGALPVNSSSSDQRTESRSRDTAASFQ